jgi:serine phosphatase RsbU (regulator of sigma subunit)
MLRKVKYKLFFSFLFFSSFSIITVVVSIWYYHQRDTISKIKQQLNEIYILSLKDFKTQQEFLTYETINPEFFKTGESKIVDQHDTISKEILKSLIQLEELNVDTHSELSGFIQKLSQNIDNYKITFNKIVIQILKRGFKDYGIEGEMRVYAHALMEIKEIDQVKILMLRRHEKDFIIRKENEYISKFKFVVEDLKNELSKNRKISKSRREEITSILNNYENTFLKLTATEKTLGLKEQSGLMLQLSQNIDRIEESIDLQKKQVSNRESVIFKKLLITAVAVLIGMLFLVFLLSYFAASSLTKPIINLTNYIEEYVNSNFTYHPTIKQKTSVNEIGVLVNNFSKMANEINTYINHFKEKVEERTAEINNQNIEINKQKLQITKQRDELTAKTETLEIQQELIQERNKNIMDSIHYAERIQRAMLPPAEEIMKILPNSFIYYQPKDIVSGDFYWINEVSIQEFDFSRKPTIKEESTYKEYKKVLFAAADCTGHGVPGAFMSIIGFNSLNKIVQEQKIYQPDIILNELDKEIKRMLRQNNHDTIKDGMDIALCCIDWETNILLFSGANNPLYLIRDSKLFEIKGDKNSIGMYKGLEESASFFKYHEIHLYKGDTIYLFSDGYVDQFGGANCRKFLKKQFKDLLVSIQHQNMEDQRETLNEKMRSWKGDEYQVDDILIFGVRI